MAHSRRKFIDALKYDKERSTYVLERMQVLYTLEQQMREEKLDWEEKTKLRQEKSVPILLELKQWMPQQLPLVIPHGGRQKVRSVRLWPTPCHAGKG